MSTTIKIKFHKPTTDKNFLWAETEYFQFRNSLSPKYINMILMDDYNKQFFDWLAEKNISDYTYTIDLDNILFLFDHNTDAEYFSRVWIYDRIYFLYSMSLLETLEIAFSDMYYIKENYNLKSIIIYNRVTHEPLFYHGMVK